MLSLKGSDSRNSIIVFGEIYERKKSHCGTFSFVGETGLEPATSSMSTMCSNQLSYPPEGLTL
jgi:hypothetical protein